MAIVNPQVDIYTVAGNGTLSFNVTHPGGGNVVLFVCVGWEAAFGDTIGGETYAGGSGTLIVSLNNGSRQLRVTRFQNPATGTKAIAFTGGTTVDTPIVVHAVWLTGVDQSIPVNGPDATDDTAGAFATPTHTMTPASDERLLMLSVCEGSATFPAVGANTAILAVTDAFVAGASNVSVGTHWTSSDGQATISLAAALSGNWASSSMEINAAAFNAGGGNGAHNLRRRRRMAA